MYDRKNFMTYVGEKSRNSYASGLNRIERLYDADIDAEYRKDRCEILLAKIEKDKLRTDLNPAALKLRSDMASHLKKYIAFKKGAENTEPEDTVLSKVRLVIESYKTNFDRMDREERYKWEAAGWYQQHWDIEAADFASMLATAFEKASNLLAANMYWPHKMMVEYAQADQETVRNLFRVLYDEKISLAERYTAFRKGFDNYVKPLNKNHYQDLHAVSVYLFFEYPEKYFIYKSRIYTNFCDRIGYQEDKTKQKSVVWKLESYMRLCGLVLDEVQKDQDLLQRSRARLNPACYQDGAFHLLTMDVVYYGAVVMKESEYEKSPGITAGTDVKLNTILYGPPGTGKTYYTVIYAVAAIENKDLPAVESEDYAEVLQRYNRYKEQKRIEFTSFHQAYGYEEFIEGIKPVVRTDAGADEEPGEIQYQIEPGIFKKFCERADRARVAPVGSADFGMNDSPNIWKVSLEGTGDNPTRRECMEGGHIRIGWDEYGEEISDETDFSEAGGKKPLNAFISRMQTGDIVLSCYSASSIDAIGVVAGEYEWHDEYARFKRLRKVNWIVKGIRENIIAANGGVSMTLSSVYRMANIALSDVFKLIEKYHLVQPSSQTGHHENYVFIIDEINRGNISKIFGELITLIEPVKRTGQAEEMKAVLPYSQKAFGVPDNVYIIGTMNTADRSVAMLDTALRRRFSFKEMLPNPGVLADVSVEDILLGRLLARMNERISILYDREHTIGHAYFMPLKFSPTVDTLAEIFKNHVLPLLQEYFYEDYEKIRLVLGDNRKDNQEEQFIIARKNDFGKLFGNIEIGLENEYSYEINYDAFENIEAYRTI